MGPSGLRPNSANEWHAARWTFRNLPRWRSGGGRTSCSSITARSGPSPSYYKMRAIIEKKVKWL
ncbi:MAG: hypothetical protein MZU95_15855 [Desulfomicrobium escambiense]|nr:hypothetical protein [Desulfomicrobium escambiense]